MKFAKPAKTFREKLERVNKAEKLNLLKFGYFGSDFFKVNTNKINFVSKKVINYVSQMQQIAQQNQFCCISGPQVMKDLKIFLINENVDQNWVSPKYAISPDNFKPYVNPQITTISENRLKWDQEFCLSYAFLKAQIRRYEEITVQYQDLQLEQHEEKLIGQKARVFQQQLDFFYGRDILDWRNNHGLVELMPYFANKLPRFSKTLEEYKSKVKDLERGYPEYFKPLTLEQLNNNCDKYYKISWLVDYQRRLLKSCKKDVSQYIGQQQEFF